MPALRIVLTFCFVGVVCSFDRNKGVEFPKNWDYYLNFWTENDSNSLDVDPATTKMDENAPHDTKNSILDLLNVMHPKEIDASMRKPNRLRLYMTELYNNLTALAEAVQHQDTNPETADPNPGNSLDSTSIRGMQAYKVFHHWNGSYSVWFNTSDVPWNRLPEQAELVLSPRHLLKGGRLLRREGARVPHLDGGKDAEWQTLLIRSGRRARPYFILDVTNEVQDWIGEMTTKPDQLPLKLTTFAQNLHKPTTLTKPFLVLYYGIQHGSLLQTSSPAIEASPRTLPALQRVSRSAVSSSPLSSTVVANKCALQDWYVDFEQLGWDNWVLAPSGLRLNYCAGECPAILIQSEYRASNHAMLRGIFRSKQPSDSIEGQRIPLACCVPTRLQAANIMYLEERKIIIRRLDGLVAEECGCQ